MRSMTIRTDELRTLGYIPLKEAAKNFGYTNKVGTSFSQMILKRGCEALTIETKTGRRGRMAVRKSDLEQMLRSKEGPPEQTVASTESEAVGYSTTQAMAILGMTGQMHNDNRAKWLQRHHLRYLQTAPRFARQWIKEDVDALAEKLAQKKAASSLHTGSPAPIAVAIQDHPNPGERLATLEKSVAMVVQTLSALCRDLGVNTNPEGVVP